MAASPLATPPAPAPTPAPTIAAPAVRVSVWVDPDLPPSWSEMAYRLARDVRAGADVTLTEVAAHDEADLRLSLQLGEPPAGAIVVATEKLVPATSARLPIREIPAGRLGDLLAGRVWDWSELGLGRSLPIARAALAGAVFPGAGAPPTRLADYDAFLTFLESNPGGIALVPAGQIDFRAGTLRVTDGADPGTSGAPLRRSLVASAGAQWDRLRPQLAKFAQVNGVRADDDPLTITFSGDVILGRTVHTIMTRLGDYSAPFRLVADELKRADLTVVDLECTLSDTIPPPSDPYTFSFMTRTAAADGLLLAGVDAVSQANNHSMNFGAAGMRETLAALDARRIAHCGIGETLGDARRPAILTRKGRRVALLGFDGITGETAGATASAPGTSPLDLDHLLADVSAARELADIVIPFIHWGVEYTLTPTAGQRRIARRAIDAGASAVIGSHPHWVQGMEVYAGRPIVYSLGNFIFDQDWSEETKQGLILHLTFDGTRLIGLRLVPIMIENFYRPRLVEGAQALAVLDRVWQSSDELGASG